MFRKSSCVADVVRDYALVVPRVDSSANGEVSVRGRPFMLRSLIVGVATSALTVGVIATPAPATASASVRAGAVRATAVRASAVLDASGNALVGRDISFPQCTGSLPIASRGAFGVIGA